MMRPQLLVAARLRRVADMPSYGSRDVVREPDLLRYYYMLPR